MNSGSKVLKQFKILVFLPGMLTLCVPSAYASSHDVSALPSEHNGSQTGQTAVSDVSTVSESDACFPWIPLVVLIFRTAVTFIRSAAPRCSAQVAQQLANLAVRVETYATAVEAGTVTVTAESVLAEGAAFAFELEGVIGMSGSAVSAVAKRELTTATFWLGEMLRNAVAGTCAEDPASDY